MTELGVSDVLTLLERVSQGLTRIQAIIAAVASAPAYLREHYPEARQELAELLQEIAKLTQLQAEASSIVTHFDFTVTGSAIDHEPRKFNDYYIAYKALAEKHRAQLDETRTHCSNIGLHAAGIKFKTDRHGLYDLFGMWTKSRSQAREAAELLGKVYSDDSKVLEEFERMADAVELALQSVRDALGPSGAKEVKNVPRAARVLAEHAASFRPIEIQANFAARELRATTVELQRPI